MAAGATYEKIATTTLGSASATVTFSSISGSYTDFIVIINGGQSVATANAYIQFNGDTGNNYSYTRIGGNGSSAVSSRESNIGFIRIDNYGWETSVNGNCIIQVQNYSNATTYKTILSRFNTAAYATQATVGLWRSTSAINRIDIKSEAYNWVSGSTFTLYGILAA